ncbi:MAG: TIGR04282 family arsenosugar biosynthesis glycosyltransferase [Gammaproteobacteria bacterium]|nr:TIGR04282 family arsenosugar biosynthesis glycosyltransferase [Gammaproteobacteria bacterium]
MFAKSPQPGVVKTRLILSLGVRGAAQLHVRLLWRSLQTVQQANLASLQVWQAGERADAFWQTCQREFKFNRCFQRGRDLGERMGDALRRTLLRSPYVLLLGSDCPSITADDLHRVMSELAAGRDAVIIPAEDGGYALIGLSRYHHSLFVNIDWGSEHVYAQTVQRLRRLRWDWLALPSRWDVDEAEDVARLLDEGYVLPEPKAALELI